jgi:DNA repair exonuclease SbcCD ATPase subunit
MIPKRIVLENFLSFGSPATEITFTDDEPLWVLGGPNGVGKSAVFDAMTYALYAEHRGGATDHASLVRHGANGFRVVFEFEFNGVAYQITRNRPLRGRPTQGIKQWSDDGWNKSVQLPPAAGRQDQVKLWAERTLGLGFDAFTASVLLRQGQADEIITATGSKRLAILKKIIGAERYEELSNRVHAVARRRTERHETLCGERDMLTRDRGAPPTEVEMQGAGDALIRAEQDYSAAQDQVNAAAEHLSGAKNWATLGAKCRGLIQQIQDAETRAAVAERTRADKKRLDDLTAAVPVLRQLVLLSCRLVTTKRLFAERQIEAKRLTDALRAKELREQIGRSKKALRAADEMKKLQDELSEFDPNLAQQLATAQERISVTTSAETAALQAKAGAAKLLEKAKGQQQKFATVAIGIPCSLCGQGVTAEHAERERDRLAAEVQQFEHSVQELDDKADAATRAKEAAAEEGVRLDRLARNQETTATLFADKQKTLRDLGVTAEPDELRQQITDMTGVAESHEAAAGDQCRADRATLQTRLGEVKKKVLSDEQTIASVEGQQSALRSQLSSIWSGQCDRLDSTAVEVLDTERQRLTSSGVAEQFRQLEEDAVRCEEWRKQLAETTSEIDATISPQCRISVATAEEGLQLVQKAAAEADRARDGAKERADDLTRLKEAHQRLAEQIEGAEKQADLHRTLDDLLGKGGLQRELVRTAEREIVRLANDTLQKLSDGDLSVELDDGTDSADEAFALRVRRADDPTPISVHYLSGSQKFRVAISVALAIGRFAAGQARQLESVIIDEGFGTLDRDGLRAAADELNRLRQHLRRIIVVSHQEDFAKRFPVVIQLTQGEDGTTAAAVRQ